MSKEYKPLNNSFHGHYKLHGCFNEQITEQILDKLDKLELEVIDCTNSLISANEEVKYWREKYETSV